jgi:hypothetical protein
VPVNRRQFLQVGFAGTIVLATVPMMSRPRASSAVLVGALAPVVLAGALPAEPAARAQAVRDVVEAFHRIVGGMSPAVQDEIGELIGLLTFAPTRILFTGLASRIEESSPQQVTAFLSRWRGSSFDLLRAGYQALTQLIHASWYGNPSSWPAIGYPGPPLLAR